MSAPGRVRKTPICRFFRAATEFPKHDQGHMVRTAPSSDFGRRCPECTLHQVPVVRGVGESERQGGRPPPVAAPAGQSLHMKDHRQRQQPLRRWKAVSSALPRQGVRCQPQCLGQSRDRAASQRFAECSVQQVMHVPRHAAPHAIQQVFRLVAISGPQRGHADGFAIIIQPPPKDGHEPDFVANRCPAPSSVWVSVTDNRAPGKPGPERPQLLDAGSTGGREAGIHDDGTSRRAASHRI